MNNENLGDRGETHRLLMATETGHIHVGLIRRMSEGNMKIQFARMIIYTCTVYLMLKDEIKAVFRSTVLCISGL